MKLLLGAEGINGIDGGCAPRREIAGEVDHGYDTNGDRYVGERVDWAHVKQERGHEAHNGERGDNSTSNADSGEQEAVANEHRRDSFLLGAQGHSNADLASALRHRVSNYAVDSDDSQQEGHSSSNTQHDQRERSARHRLRVEIAKCVDFGHRQLGINRPDGLANLLQERLRASTRSAHDERNTAAHNLLFGFKMVNHRRPVNGRWCILTHTVVVSSGNDANDLEPGIGAANAQALAKRAVRRDFQTQGPREAFGRRLSR